MNATKIPLKSLQFSLKQGILRNMFLPKKCSNKQGNGPRSLKKNPLPSSAPRGRETCPILTLCQKTLPRGSVLIPARRKKGRRKGKQKSLETKKLKKKSCFSFFLLGIFFQSAEGATNFNSLSAEKIEYLVTSFECCSRRCTQKVPKMALIEFRNWFCALSQSEQNQKVLSWLEMFFDKGN